MSSGLVTAPEKHSTADSGEQTPVPSQATKTDAVQVVYLPSRHCFALWSFGRGTADAELAAGTTTVELVVPISDSQVGVRSVQVVFVAATASDLKAAVHAETGSEGNESASYRGWLAILEYLEDQTAVDAIPEALLAELPWAAHAVPDTGGSQMLTACGAADALRTSLKMQSFIDQARLAFTPRPYQLRGASWMSSISESGGGGILADEMGLGKTLQSIAHLVTRAAGGRGPHLVVCPTSLISNWRREIETFSGGTLNVNVYRGPNRALSGAAADPSTVTIMGYPTLRSDTDAVTRITWDSVFLDEAHVLKNARTKIAQAARRLDAATRIALTGTPVENRMEELWSLIDLTNPGLLGTRARFTRRFAVPIEQRSSATALAQLSATITPVVLRRTKAQVATDLPPKQHTDVLCPISSEQAALYNSAIEAAFSSGFGPKRSRGTAILSLLTSLKHICNHPSLVSGDTSELPGRSGKLDRLTEIVEELSASGESALIFTQYRQTGELLSRHVQNVTGCAIPFFHGGLDVDKRDEMVDEFQNGGTSPVLILSLRAAGYGLNLTRASTVVHYDRWWNPAVEAQATDRVHRIGQQSRVTVLALTTEGTIEEHIAAMHDRKKAIAGLTESGSETALAALDDAMLHKALSLRAVGA